MACVKKTCPVTIPASERRTRVVVQRRYRTSDGLGGKASETRTIGSFWAKVVEVSDREQYQDQKLDGVSTYHVWAVWADVAALGMTTDDVAIIADFAPGNVRGVTNVDLRNITAKVTVEVGVVP